MPRKKRRAAAVTASIDILEDNFDCGESEFLQEEPGSGQICLNKDEEPDQSTLMSKSLEKDRNLDEDRKMDEDLNIDEEPGPSGQIFINVDQNPNVNEELWPSDQVYINVNEDLDVGEGTGPSGQLYFNADEDTDVHEEPGLSGHIYINVNEDLGVGEEPGPSGQIYIKADEDTDVDEEPGSSGHIYINVDEPGPSGQIQVVIKSRAHLQPDTSSDESLSNESAVMIYGHDSSQFDETGPSASNQNDVMLPEDSLSELSGAAI